VLEVRCGQGQCRQRRSCDLQIFTCTHTTHHTHAHITIQLTRHTCTHTNTDTTTYTHTNTHILPTSHTHTQTHTDTQTLTIVLPQPVRTQYTPTPPTHTPTHPRKHNLCICSPLYQEVFNFFGRHVYFLGWTPLRDHPPPKPPFRCPHPDKKGTNLLPFQVGIHLHIHQDLKLKCCRVMWPKLRYGRPCTHDLPGNHN